MLFLQALLLFVFGIYGVAIPISPMISHISPRSNVEPNSGPTEQHTVATVGHQDGFAKLEKPEHQVFGRFRSGHSGRFPEWSERSEQPEHLPLF